MQKLLLLALALAALPAAAQVRTADVVSWSARAEPAAAGETARLVFDAQIAPGWRLYALRSPVGIPLTLALDVLPAGLTPGPLRQSAPREGYDPGFDSDYPYFAERARLVQAVRVGRGVADGAREVSGALRYAVCDDSVCLPPARTTFRVPLVVE